MKAICPNNIEHKQFVTTAHVCQDWVVDENGDFLEEENSCVEVTHGPDADNIWTCKICGAEAVIEKDSGDENIEQVICSTRIAEAIGDVLDVELVYNKGKSSVNEESPAFLQFAKENGACAAVDFISNAFRENNKNTVDIYNYLTHLRYKVTNDVKKVQKELPDNRPFDSDEVTKYLECTINEGYIEKLDSIISAIDSFNKVFHGKKERKKA